MKTWLVKIKTLPTAWHPLTSRHSVSNFDRQIVTWVWWALKLGECQDCPPQDCPLGGNSEVGNPESISHQDCPPQLLSFWWIVFAWYRPRVNARDTDSILNYNILKNNIIFAIWGDFINHTVKKSLTTTLSWWRWYMVDFFSGRTDHIKSGDKLSSVIVNKQWEENRSDLGHSKLTSLQHVCQVIQIFQPTGQPYVDSQRRKVTHVIRMQQISQAVNLTSSFTARRSHTNVLNAANHSVKLEIWSLTCSERRGTTSEHNATKLEHRLLCCSSFVVTTDYA